jgi:hypothetical protein
VLRKNLPNILPGNAEHVGYVWHTDEIGGCLNENRIRDSLPYIVNCTEQRLLCGICVARKVQGDSTALANANEGVIAARLIKAIDV